MAGLQVVVGWWANVKVGVWMGGWGSPNPHLQYFYIIGPRLISRPEHNQKPHITKD